MSLIILNNKKFHLTFQEIFQQVKIPKYSVIIALSPIDLEKCSTTFHRAKNKSKSLTKPPSASHGKVKKSPEMIF